MNSAFSLENQPCKFKPESGISSPYLTKLDKHPRTKTNTLILDTALCLRRIKSWTKASCTPLQTQLLQSSTFCAFSGDLQPSCYQNDRNQNLSNFGSNYICSKSSDFRHFATSAYWQARQSLKGTLKNPSKNGFFLSGSSKFVNSSDFIWWELF